MQYRSQHILAVVLLSLCHYSYINSPRASGAVIEVLNESYDMACVPKPYKYPITEAEWVTPSPVNSATCRCQYLQPILVLDDFSAGQSRQGTDPYSWNHWLDNSVPTMLITVLP
jgi:hypothetical protein